MTETFDSESRMLIDGKLVEAASGARFAFRGTPTSRRVAKEAVGVVGAIVPWTHK